MALTETTETNDTILKDDCALVVACLSNLSTFALQQPPPGMRHPGSGVASLCAQEQRLCRLARGNFSEDSHMRATFYRIRPIGT